MIEALSTIAVDLAQSGVSVSSQGPQGPAEVFDVANFEAAMRGVDSSAAPEASADVARSDGASFRSVLENLDSLNGRVDLLSDSALEYASGAREFTPGDMLEMTVRCHQFLFQCELTTNVANRSSDGIQQLFRQQS